MSAIQTTVHDIGQIVQGQWNRYFADKQIHEILYDIVGAVMSCAAVIYFFANPAGALLSLTVCSLSSYLLHKITALENNPPLKLALTLLVTPILGMLSAHLIGFPVCYFTAVLIHSATLWAASKCPMPQEEALT
jgi:hypothetical protein